MNICVKFGIFANKVIPFRFYKRTYEIQCLFLCQHHYTCVMKKIVITLAVNQGLRHFGSMEYYETYGKLPGKHFL